MTTTTATPEKKEGMQEEEVTIGKQLFPDAYGQPEATPPVTEPKENAKEEGAIIPTPEPSVTPPAPPVEATPPPVTIDYLDLEAVKGKKAKLKVDGKEIEVPAEELIRNYQTWQHLSRVGQVLGEQKKSIKEELARLEQLRQPTQAQEEVNSWKEVVDPYIRPVNAEVEALKVQVTNLNEALRPTVIKSNVDRTDEMLKVKGLTDFKEYYPRIQNFILENIPPDQLHQFDNQDTFVALYHEMKLEDMVKAPAKSISKTPIVPVPTVPSSNIVPPIESSNASTNIETTSAIDKKIEVATAKAMASASSWDWAEVLRLRGEKATS